MTGSVILNIWVNFMDRRWLLPTPSSIEWSTIHSLMGSGMAFFMLQIAGLIVFNSDNLVISHYMGPADVVPYAVTWKVATYATILETILFSSLWPAYAEAYARGDYAWVRRTFWGGVRYGMGAVVLACSVLVVVGRPLIHWYVNASAVPSERLLIAICFWTIMCTGMNLQACLLAAVGRIKLQGALSIVCSATNLWLSIMLVKRIGSLGAVLGTIISYAVVLVVPQTITVWRVLYRPPAHHSWPESAEAAHELG
jgi:O-antigen/teichoic acid export membrane protein